MSDLVIVAHHFSVSVSVSVSDGPRGDTPPRFAEEFAHAAVDGGADIYVGHGWHRTLGIEIYKGKPIIYGIGNFWANSKFLQRVPYDSYEAWGHDMEALGTLHPALHPLHPGLDHSGETWWGSCVLQAEMSGGELRRLHLHPVEMGRELTPEAKLTRRTGKGDHPLTEGRPMLAKGDVAQRILERYQRLSAAYGTEIDIHDGRGIIDLSRAEAGTAKRTLQAGSA